MVKSSLITAASILCLSSLQVVVAFQSLVSTSLKTKPHHSNYQQRHTKSSSSSSTILTAISRREAFDQVVSKTTAASVIATTSTAATTATTTFYPSIVNAAETSTTDTTSSTNIPTIKLGGNKSSLEVSRTIQGYWQLAGGHGKYNIDNVIETMQKHYDAGITTLDTADIYGPSEQIVGKFVEKMKNGNANSNVIPCTKFCCFRYLDEIDKTEVRDRINKARERLQVDKLPLVQFFWSNYDIKRYVDVALMLTELKEEGLIQEIGATNFDLPRLKELKDAGVPIVSHQVQLSCLDQRPVQSGMADWCKENDISLIAFGTVGSGILSDKYLGRDPPSQEEKNTSSMKMYSKTAERFGSWNLVQDLLKTMDAVAADVRSSGRCNNANISNIAQRYVLDTNAVASVLIGVRNANHIEENVRTHSFALTSGERDAITSVINKRKGPSGDVWDLERGNLPGKK